MATTSLETADGQREASKCATQAHITRGDVINDPQHYKSGDGLEAIDVIEAFDLGFHLGNVFKYMARHKKKGRPLEDIRKAEWYLKRYIARLTR